ncbi:MAG TPA: Hpt domain-containing protein, partial [Candidatus Dormibacteraeota bacterium]|nr:Hpt domain-containing protein [Candidatus Dormibacteraeota bacterium]
MPLLATMREKATEGDAQAVWRAAHAMRSSASAIGASAVAQRCVEIEVQARDHGILPSGVVLAALNAELAAASRELRELVDVDAPAA